MPKIVILGSARIADADHGNTHMAVVSDDGAVLIDCVGFPIVRLERAGIGLDSLDDLILTHFHPDHVSGVPLLLMDMWLTRRNKPLKVYGLHHCLERIEHLMGFFQWENWPNFFPVAFHRLPEQESVQVFETKQVRYISSPVRHVIPTIGLRMELIGTDKSIVYSCDTEPCDEVIGLAQGAQVLIHEAAGEVAGHSSALQAAQIAQKANVERLVLIHYPARTRSDEEILQEARGGFEGEVVLATDFMEISFS
jgi:ribonuclease Z